MAAIGDPSVESVLKDHAHDHAVEVMGAMSYCPCIHSPHLCSSLLGCRNMSNWIGQNEVYEKPL